MYNIFGKVFIFNISCRSAHSYYMSWFTYYRGDKVIYISIVLPSFLKKKGRKRDISSLEGWNDSRQGQFDFLQHG